MSATERQYNPGADFLENSEMFKPALDQQMLPERGHLSNYFSLQAGVGINPLEPDMEMPTLADNSNTIMSEEERLRREVISNSSIQVSENLVNAPTVGLKCEEPKQSDVGYGACSLFSLTGEALGLKSNGPDELEMPQVRMANAFDFKNTWNGPRAPMA